MKRRAFTLVEAMVAAIIVVVAFLVMLSVASTSLRESTRTRQEILSDCLMQNLMEEIWEHPYGDGHGWWGDGSKSKDQAVNVVIEGRQVAVSFHLQVQVAADQGGNGSFFGASNQDYDVVTLTCSWEEASGASSDAQKRKRQCSMGVWRQGGLPSGQQ